MFLFVFVGFWNFSPGRTVRDGVFPVFINIPIYRSLLPRFGEGRRRYGGQSGAFGLAKVSGCRGPSLVVRLSLNFVFFI